MTLPKFQKVPLNLAGSSTFGRYPKISIEKTYNMILSDKWLVPLGGHERINEITLGQQGRGIYNSTQFNHMISVIDNNVYITSTTLETQKLTTINTYAGDVFIAENNAKEIAICDKQDIWIFNYENDTFQKAETSPGVALDFLPGYIAFHDTRFIAPDLNSSQWRLSEPNNGLSFPPSAAYVGEFQTKSDIPQAVIPMPGISSMIFVMGKNVGEPWNDLGLQLFPYKKNTSFNIDYGVLNAATIDTLENFMVWLGANEQSGPTIMYTSGGNIKQVSTDGINFQLSELNAPQKAYGFLRNQDGHLLYQLTFYDANDNLTLIYDFNTKKFFHACDENMDYHIAKRIVFFNNDYYFLSINDGNIYRTSSDLTTYNGAQIPRVRMCKNIRLKSSEPFITNKLSFTLDQGNNTSLSDIDLNISKDGGASFSNGWRKNLNDLGSRQNILHWYSLGESNDFVPQFRFWGQGRFLAANGEVEIYQ